MGLIGGLLGDNPPEPKIIPLDAGTKKIVGDQYQQALDPNLAGKMTAGVQESGNSFLNSSNPDQKAASTGDNASTLQAIRNQYRNEAQGGISNILKQTNRNIPAQRMGMLNTATHSSMAMDNIEAQNNEMLIQAQFHAEMARAQVLQGILGAGGMMAGAYMAKGPSTKTPGSPNGGTDLNSSGGHSYGNNSSQERL